MLESLDQIPWAELEHAYGSAEDVPELIRALRNPDPAVRSNTLWTLYGNLFHQGTRYPATPYAVPFLIELCSDPETPARGDILDYWKSLITGYFTVQERPIWGDGERIYWGNDAQEEEGDDPYSTALHEIYRESLRGHALLLRLLDEDEPPVRAGSAGVLACLATVAEQSIPALITALQREPSGAVRAAYAFALGELGCTSILREILRDDDNPAAQCMAACELARIEADASLIEPLLTFVAEPIDGYESLPGAGGKSTGDAADAIQHLPADVQRLAIPALCDRLQQSRSFDTMPLVRTLLAIGFEPAAVPVTDVNATQRQILRCLVDCQELWTIGNLISDFQACGLPPDRQKCAELAGVRFAHDQALEALSTGALFSKMGFLDQAREHFERALDQDALVFERTPEPDECWLFYAKAYAETDPDRAKDAFWRAVAIQPQSAFRVDPTWALARLIGDEMDA